MFCSRRKPDNFCCLSPDLIFGFIGFSEMILTISIFSQYKKPFWAHESRTLAIAGAALTVLPFLLLKSCLNIIRFLWHIGNDVSLMNLSILKLKTLDQFLGLCNAWSFCLWQCLDNGFDIQGYLTIRSTQRNEKIAKVAFLEEEDAHKIGLGIFFLQVGTLSSFPPFEYVFHVLP